MANLRKHVTTVEGIQRLLQIPKVKGEVVWTSVNRQQIITLLIDQEHKIVFEEAFSVFAKNYPQHVSVAINSYQQKIRQILLLENNYLWYFAETFLKKIKVSGCQVREAEAQP